MIILVGPSASGKTEIAKYIMNNYHLKKVVTYTTRNIRINEVDGVDYNFVSKEMFINLKNNDFFVETTLYNNNFYGTAKKDITDDKIVVLDPNGLKSFNALHDNHIVSFYLECNENIRYQRMVNRNDKIEDIKKRLLNDKEAFNINNIDKIDFIINSEANTIENLAKNIMEKYNNIIR